MEKHYFLFLATFVACFAPATTTIISSVVSSNNTRDLDALLAFKATIVDPQNILPSNWSTSTSVCNWIGITCNSRHKRVAAIDLPQMDLAGTMPPQLGNLSFLVRLNLSNNSFHGNLPNGLAHLRRLKYIDLAFNSFDGEFPSWLGALSQLRHLSFLYNRFSGSLSPAVFNSTKLETIRLAENFLTGNLPQDLSTLQNLKVLDMGNNTFGGSLPRSLFNLSSLQELKLTNNSFSGYLPARICHHLPQLQGIYFSFNEFEGEIPSGIGDCSRLQILSLSYNNLGGNIPREVWNLTTLRGLYLGGNDLHGEIPKDIGNLTNLEILGMESANLTEYGLQGLVSTMCDVYSFGIMLMETFTKKNPKDEMFAKELSLRLWIQNSLSDSIIQVIDIDLLHREDEVGKNKIECVSSILLLALSCTTDAPGERINMKDVLRALQKIKINFLENSSLETGSKV